MNVDEIEQTLCGFKRDLRDRLMNQLKYEKLIETLTGDSLERVIQNRYDNVKLIADMNTRFRNTFNVSLIDFNAFDLLSVDMHVRYVARRDMIACLMRIL